MFHYSHFPYLLLLIRAFDKPPSIGGNFSCFLLDGLGSGFGYAWIILAVAFFRELLGSGAVFGFKVFEAIGIDNFPTNGLMVTPVGAFMIIGLIIWVQRTKTGYVEK